MPKGEELEALVSEMTEGGLSKTQILDTIFSQDYDTPVSELVRLLEVTPQEVGRRKGITKKRLESAQKAEGLGGAEGEEGEPTVIFKFREALKDNIIRKEARAFSNTLVSKFSKRYNQLMTSSQNLMNWLMVQGCDSAEANRITDDMFIPSAQQGYGGQQGYAQVVNPQTGQMQTVPIIMMQPSMQQQPNILAIDRGAQPQPIFMPQFPQPAGIDRETQSRIDRLERAVTELADTIRSQTQPQQLGRQMRRIPVTDNDGTILTDPKGRVIYQEVPYDPMMSAIELLRGVGAIGGQQQQPIDEEKLVYRMRDMVRDEVGKATPPKEKEADDAKMRDLFREERERLGTQIEHLNKRLEGIEGKREMEQVITDAIAPIQERISQMETRSGLSDSQFTLTHREHLAGMWLDAIRSVVDAGRQDARPLLLQSSIAALKQLGVSDDIIQTVVQSMSASVPQVGGRSSKIASMKAEWTKQ